ncbi:MAG: 1-acyl-sn-glycerol-3-phosphate acyltransferase [Deltaproteobacteria bacterium]|nr:1-acyl-sn-glycerol-3-phosphate acyltransferase [Deltaproteobacteria bacterium]
MVSPATNGKSRAGSCLVVPLMNLTVFPLILLWTALGIFLVPVGFVIWKITTRWDADKIMRQFVWIYGRGWLLIMAPFVRFKRVGAEAGKFKPPCILVANHFSFFDTFCMAILPFSDAAFAIRAWPFKMFWYAPFMHLARYINVESMDWRKISETTVDIISKGGALLFFPEDHRSRNRQLQRFYSGAFKLAIETGAKIVPLCLSGTDELLPPGRWWLRPARVTLKVLEPVDPKDFTGDGAHRTMCKVVREGMARSLGEMTAETCNLRQVSIPADSSQHPILPEGRESPTL